MANTVSSTYRRHRRALGRALRDAREDAGLSGNQLAKNLGWAQSKVSRIETGAQVPTESDVVAWSLALNLPKGERAQLLTILEQAETEYRTWRDNYQLAGGAAGKQRELFLIESSATSMRQFQPNLVPGLLQTPGYARELLLLPFGPRTFGATDADVDHMVAARLERQQILYDPTKQIHIVVLESALLARVCSPDTLYEQLTRLVGLCALRSLSIGIVPMTSHLPLIPMGGFIIYDDDLVVLETLSGEEQVSSSEDIAQYSASFVAVSKAAVYGSEATRLLDELATRMRC